MKRGGAILVIALAVAASGCGGNLGLGLPACETPVSNPSPAIVLVAQAVPTAHYAPCINSVKLGWDEIELSVKSGRAALEIGREFADFLHVSLTESCDITEATPVPSGLDGINRYESIHEVTNEIRVTIIPTGERPRIHALSLAEQLAEVRVDGRPLILTVDEDIDFTLIRAFEAIAEAVQ